MHINESALKKAMNKTSKCPVFMLTCVTGISVLMLLILNYPVPLLFRKEFRGNAHCKVEKIGKNLLHIKAQPCGMRLPRSLV